ncbi:MAG: hypothetical protein ACYC5A_06165 [Thermoleophilia bacterium]
MDAKYFCDTMNSELTSLKARIYNIVREMDRMPEDTRAGLGAQITEMHGMVDDLKAKIDALGHECPADWSAQKQDIESIKATLTEKIDIWDAEHIAGGYVGG